MKTDRFGWEECFQRKREGGGYTLGHNYFGGGQINSQNDIEYFKSY